MGTNSFLGLMAVKDKAVLNTYEEKPHKVTVFCVLGGNLGLSKCKCGLW